MPQLKLLNEYFSLLFQDNSATLVCLICGKTTILSLNAEKKKCLTYFLAFLPKFRKVSQKLQFFLPPRQLLKRTFAKLRSAKKLFFFSHLQKNGKHVLLLSFLCVKVKKYYPVSLGYVSEGRKKFFWAKIEYLLQRACCGFSLSSTLLSHKSPAPTHLKA